MLRESLRRLAWRLESRAGLAALFALALLVRLALAPFTGFRGDLQLFQTWATLLGQVGPHHFYAASAQSVDYPPGYLYVLWLTAKLSAAPGYLLLKLPPIVADFGLAWVVCTLAARIAPPSFARRWPVRPLVAAAFLFNPAVLAIGAVWGQVDSLPALLALAPLALLLTGEQSRGRELGAFLLFACAVAIKPQAAFVAPVLLYVLYRRHLHGRRGAELLDGALAVGMTGATSVCLWCLSGVPFGLGPLALLRFDRQAASVYPVTSANAFNLWGALGFWRPDTGGQLQVGALAFLAGAGYVIWRAHRALGRGADEARVLVAAAGATTLLAFILLTRMHERYLFFALVCLAPLVVVRRLRLPYAALCGLFLLDLWYPYVYFNAEHHTQTLAVQPLFGWLFGGFTTDSVQRTVWSLLLTATALVTVRRALAWADESAAVVAVARPRRVRVRGDASAATLAATGRLPLALVGLACGFGLVTLRGQTSAAVNLNDSAFHLQMVRWASGRISAGRLLPLDGWYPDLSLGSAFFHRYQSFAELMTAYV